MVLSERLAEISGRMAAAEARSGREAGSVRLLAVVKRQSDEDIREVISLGVTDLAENYVQEWRARVERFGEGV